jgi:protein-tyrosine-phosphatase
MQRVLFVDPDHGSRSQMAEALLRNAVALAAGVSPDQYDVASAGTDPAGSLEGVAEVLREIGVGFEPARRALVTALTPPPDLLIVVCEEDCGSCPYVPGARQVGRWPQPDPDQVPADERTDVLRHIREDLGTRVAMLVNLGGLFRS